MRTLLLAIFLVGALASSAAAQCCGDCAGDGSVTIDDLIRAVGNALDGCAETPTVGPSATPTRQPTPTRTPIRCPRDFTDTNNQCTFNGRYNAGCGSAVTAAFAVSGTTVVVSVNTGLSGSQAVVRFAAQRDTASSANLTGWSSNNFQTTHPVAGLVELQDSGEQLIVFPNDPPFMIQGCNFVQYVGDYLQPRSASAANPLDATDFVSLRAWRERPLPDLADRQAER
jgi:hypothetical protein